MCQGVSCCAHEAVSGYQGTPCPSPTTHIFMLYSRALYSTLYRCNRLYNTRPVTRALYSYTAYTAYTTLYNAIQYTAIQRYTVYSLYNTPQPKPSPAVPSAIDGNGGDDKDPDRESSFARIAHLAPPAKKKVGLPPKTMPSPRCFKMT